MGNLCAQVRRQQDRIGAPNQGVTNNMEHFGGAVEDLTQRTVDEHAQAGELQEDNLRLCSALANDKATNNNMQVQVHGMGSSIHEQIQEAVAAILNTVYKQAL